MSSLPALAPAPALVFFGIPALAVLVAVLFVVGVRHAVRAAGRPPAVVQRATIVAALAVAAWMALSAMLASAGVFLRFDLRPPPMLLMMVAIFGGGVALALSRVGRWLSALPLGVLVLAQGFRFPLELVMHQAAGAGVMPVQLSYSGYNFDIVTGASALVLGALLLKGRAPRALVWAWNLFGSGCLLVIAFIALAGSPIVRLWGDQSLNVWVLHFPYVWLPAVMVMFAVAGHAVVFRRLLARDATDAPAPAARAAAVSR